MAYELQPAAERYALDPTPEHRQAVAVAALPLVRSLARRISLPDHPLATREDLENAGMLGMLQALDTYNPERGTAFASFAYARIRGAFVDFLRTIDLLSRDRRRRVAEAQRAADELQQQLGAEPRAQQVAEHLGLSVEDYHGLLSDAQRRFTLSLHTERDDHRASPIETIAHPVPDEEHASFETRSLYEHVARLIQRFPEREQRIVNLYYFENLTLREIAEQFSLTEARISQILSKTLKTLRGHLQMEMRLAA
ncbi:MAG: FliA/WhiG family RNA polymerase sigma factor [Rhodothermales bacterium]|nr:FliA/WhiG family RNA polymerase sigma factor [Rhodothermales bacterium]